MVTSDAESSGHFGAQLAGHQGLKVSEPEYFSGGLPEPVQGCYDSAMSSQTLQLTPELRQYIAQVGMREPAVLQELRAETAELGDSARMQISPEQGQLMALLVETLQAKRVLEVGTFTGYSALACALALPEEGQLVACDISEEWTSIAKRYWQKAGVAEKIDLRIAPASQTLKKLISEGPRARFDLMFIDADKTSYDEYYELGLLLLRQGGLMLIDNVLWGGSVVDPEDQDENTIAIRQLNKKLSKDERITVALLPIGDGLTLARKR